MQQETAVNRAKTPASWHDINWCRNQKLVRNLRQRIYRASRQGEGVTGLLEPCAVKAARTVLRGGGASNGTSLPDRKGQPPSGSRRLQEAKASRRKATGIHNRLDRAYTQPERVLTCNW